jgi:hypothetical protein
VKRRDLERHLREHGARLLREGPPQLLGIRPRALHSAPAPPRDRLAARSHHLQATRYLPAHWLALSRKQHHICIQDAPAHARSPGAAFVLVFALRVDTKRLANILLVDAHKVVVKQAAIVALDNDRALAIESSDVRACGDEARVSGRVEADVLVQVVIIEADDSRLEDVTGCEGSRRNPPTSIQVQQSGLGLSAREAELAGEVATEPRRRVLAQVSQPLRDCVELAFARYSSS